MEFNLLPRPALEFHGEECESSARENGELNPKNQVQEHDPEEDKDQVQEQCNDVSAAALLKLKIPSYMEAEKCEKDDEPNDGLKTPTSSDHKIPAILQCPPAPRKPKTIPSRKRRYCRPPIVLDMSKEIESLFATPVVADLGGKIKKVKQGN